MHSAAGRDVSELLEYIQELVDLNYLKPNGEGKYIVLNAPYLEDTTELEMILMDRIQEYRDLFNVKPGWMGDKQSCIKKLHKWLNNNKSSTFEDVIAAATYYVSITDHKYLMRADYFIEKNGMSTLSAFIEDMEKGNVEDWTKRIL